jgi:hypothetical protein
MSFFTDFVRPVLTVGAVAAGAVGLGWISVATATSMVVTYAISTIISRTYAPNKEVPQTQANNIRQQVPPDPTANIPVVYGDAYTGGRFVDAVLTTDQQTMYYVMAISCISPNGQFSFDTSKFYYQDQIITFDTVDPTKVISLTDNAGNVDTAINGYLYISLFTSSASGTITPYNGTLQPYQIMSTANGIPSGQEWASSNRQMNGLAFAIIRLVYNAASVTTSSLQPITFHVSHYLNGTGAAKPGDVWYDYLTNTIYGGAVDPDYVDSASATALNAYSDTLISYTPYSGGSATQPRYRFNGVLDTGHTVLSNIDVMMLCCDSWQSYQASTGKWTVVINRDISPSFAFDDTNIVGNINVGSTDITQQINVVEARFNDSTNRDQAGYVNIQLPSILLYPNEPVNKYTTSYDLVNNSVIAQYLATRILEQNRIDLAINFQTTYVGIQVNAGDVVTVTNDYYGWSSKQFRVVQVRETVLPDGTLGASFQLIAYDPAVYTTPDITQYFPVPNSGLASVNYFSALTTPVVASSSPTATIPSFSVNTYIPTIGRVTQVILYYTTSSSPTPSDWLVWGSQISSNSQAFTPGATITFDSIQLPGASYYFAYKVVNEITTSKLSSYSSLFIWNPNPTTTAVAGTFLATFAPTTMQVPRNSSGSPTFTGLIAQLYGAAAGGAINFTTAQTDSDPAFVNNSWRIGASSTTGNTDIVTSNITLGSPTAGGSTYAQWAAPSAMSSSPATLTVPVRYKSALGVVSQGANAILQYVFVDQGLSGYSGTAGNQTATVYLYQWSTTTPGNPSGTTTYNWSSGANTSYTGGNGWSVTVPTNPGTPGLYLWIAQIQILAPSGTATTIVSWTSGYSIQAWAGNGASGYSGNSGYSGINGVKTAVATVYQWSITIPTGPTGTSTYTWSTSSFSPDPSGWSSSITTSPSPGFTLWAANVQVSDSASAATTIVNWTTASIISAGYAGDSGYSGASGYSGSSGYSGVSGFSGSTGTTGASSRICYADVTGSSLSSTPATVTTSGSTSFPPNNSWGGGEVWQATPPTITAGHSVFQSDGIYNPATGNTVWNVPYLSNLKVGQLSAISADLGNITAGDLQIGTSPALSGTTMTGTGAHIYASGNFAFGSSTTNMVFNGTNVYLNGFQTSSTSQTTISSIVNGGVDCAAILTTFNPTKTNNITISTNVSLAIDRGSISSSSQLNTGVAFQLCYWLPATSIISGRSYAIVSLGSTNFISIGAANNNIGTIFTATGSGSGSGTVAQLYNTLSFFYYRDTRLTPYYGVANVPFSYTTVLQLSRLTLGYVFVATNSSTTYYSSSGAFLGYPISIQTTLAETSVYEANI